MAEIVFVARNIVGRDRGEAIKISLEELNILASGGSITWMNEYTKDTLEMRTSDSLAFRFTNSDNLRVAVQEFGEQGEFRIKILEHAKPPKAQEIERRIH